MTRADDFTAAEHEILLARTAAVARRDGQETVAREPAVYFRVGRQRYCAFARSIRGAGRLDGMVPVPHGGRSVAGAIVRNGNAVPVFHLASLVGDRISRLPETAHGLFLGDATDELALAVDAIDGFGEIVRADLRHAPDDAQSRWVASATADGTLVLDVETLLASSTLWVDGRLNRTE